ncbi:FAD-binding oxidoreductase [Actinomycetes bacterium KLBMP 9759]
MGTTVEPVSGRLGAAAENSLRSLVHGAVFTPREAGYEDVRAVYNGSIDRRPEAVVQVSGVADIARTVRFARENGFAVSVRGGGHGVAGMAVAGEIVIDLSALRGVTVDPVAGTAVVQGGATWAEVDAATQAHGLAVPGGRVSHTGVAGLTLGGGEGWLTCRHGLTSDNLIAVDVVTADAQLVVASETESPELFWALRGGGGNFGVVTSFTFRLHPVGPLVLGGMLAFEIAAAPDVMRVLQELHAEGYADLGAAAAFLTAPPAPFVPGDVVGRPIIAVIPAWFGDIEEGMALLGRFREVATPVIDAVAPMPYVALQSMLDAGAQPGMRNRWSGGFVPEVKPDLVAALQDAAVRMPSPLSQIIISPLPDSVRALPDDATAFPSRSGRWLVHPVGVWPAPETDETGIAWTRDLAAIVRASGETGTYLNLDESDDARVRWAMGEARFQRLQQVKKAWDPQDMFRFCAHIPLP